MAYDLTPAGHGGRHEGRQQGGGVYLGTNGSGVDNAVVKGKQSRRSLLRDVWQRLFDDRVNCKKPPHFKFESGFATTFLGCPKNLPFSLQFLNKQ